MHEPRDDERRSDAQRPPAAAQHRRIAGIADQAALIQNVVNKKPQRIARSLRTQQQGPLSKLRSSLGIALFEHVLQFNYADTGHMLAVSIQLLTSVSHSSSDAWCPSRV